MIFYEDDARESYGTTEEAGEWKTIHVPDRTSTGFTAGPTGGQIRSQPNGSFR